MSLVLHCHGCAEEKRLTDPQVLELLQNRGMLKRDNDADSALLRELLNSVANSLPCNECGGLGLLVKDDWSDDWSDEVVCEGCKATIDPDRLEVFPDTKFCPKCQADHEAGGMPGQETEYCLRCGGVMKLTKRGGSGTAGYQMACGECGKKA